MRCKFVFWSFTGKRFLTASKMDRQPYIILRSCLRPNGQTTHTGNMPPERDPVLFFKVVIAHLFLFRHVYPSSRSALNIANNSCAYLSKTTCSFWSHTSDQNTLGSSTSALLKSCEFNPILMASSLSMPGWASFLVLHNMALIPSPLCLVRPSPSL